MLIDASILIALLALSGIFSGSEIALFSLSNAKIKSLVENGVKNADILQHIKSQPQRLLSVILIGNNVVNISASAYATVIATDVFGNSGAGIAVGIMTLLVLVFGEITPKAMATAHNVEFSLRIAPGVNFLMKALTPFGWALEHLTRFIMKITKAPQLHEVTEEEIKAVIYEGAQTGSLDKEEHEMLENVFEFDDLKAEDAMTVYKDIIGVDGDKKLSDVLKKLVRTPYSRIPVYESEKNNIIGILRLREVLKYIGESFEDGTFDAEIRVRDMASKPYFVPESKPIDEIMKEFKKRHKHIAIVVNEYGDTVGIITMEDILEQLVGQIADETDVDEMIIKRIDRNNILVDGDEEIDEVNDFFNVNLQGPKNNSISWLLLQHFERIPQKGEIITIDNVDFKVIEATDRTILKVQLTKKDI